VHDQAIESLSKSLQYEMVKWSDLKENTSTAFTKKSTLVIDTIGLLTKAYSYADFAYVGGAMGTKGLHNILEAATYGVPVIIGKNYSKFPEASKLEDLGGLFSVKNPAEFESITNKLFEDDHFRDKTGMICGHWINSNTGATREIVTYLKSINEELILD
jgi:3-deoxy-D-manno-octulosonic-acid transferase